MSEFRHINNDNVRIKRYKNKLNVTYPILPESEVKKSCIHAQEINLRINYGSAAI